jgi:hypothetical protein
VFLSGSPLQLLERPVPLVLCRTECLTSNTQLISRLPAFLPPAHASTKGSNDAGLTTSDSLESTAALATIACIPHDEEKKTVGGVNDVSRVYNGSADLAGVTGQGTVVVRRALYVGDTVSGSNFAYTDKNAGGGNKTVSQVTSVNKIPKCEKPAQAESLKEDKVSSAAQP